MKRAKDCSQTSGIEQKALGQLDFLIEDVYEEVAIADGNGVFVRVSKMWEERHKATAAEVIGIGAAELEKRGIFLPSVTLEVMKQKKRVEMIQTTKHGETILVTGVPVLDANQRIQWIVSYSSWDISSVTHLREQYTKLQKDAESYTQEIRELRKKGAEVSQLIFGSDAMKELDRLVDKVAAADVNLLITGESGVGKSSVAKLIHSRSARADYGFIEINCGAIPEHLLESELFGYEEGSFTGAKKTGKVGTIELAKGGTLFLDEVGDLPMNLQVKLLKTIQDKEITRVGGIKPIAVDFRLISATNLNLENRVKENKFRVDLYYRLKGVPIYIPPLRMRCRDIEVLVEVFLKRINKKYGRQKRIHEEVMDIFRSYSWPGNVRELENIIEQMVIMSDDDVITSHDLPDNMIFLQNLDDESGMELKKAMEFYEGKLINMAYKKYKTTVGVAKALKISQPSAARKVQKYVGMFKYE